MLNSYGGKYLETPNFNRLAKKSVQFNIDYIGSMPCMPARRDMHSGRLSFLHRSWGPLEPFDNSFPELLRLNNTYTHLVTCLLYTSPSPRDQRGSRKPSSA